MLKRALVSLLFVGGLAFAAPLTNRPFVNQDGKPFQLHDLKGNYVFVSFVFTRCPLPSMCPLTMTLNKQLYSEWKKTKKAPPLKFLVVTLDPAFDTPAVLRGYAKARGVNNKDFTLATGNATVLSDFAGEFNVIGMPAGGTISHNLKSILLAPDLSVLQEYKDNEFSPSQVLKDIRTNANPPTNQAR